MAELSLPRLSRAGRAGGQDRAKTEGRWRTRPLFGEPDGAPRRPGSAVDAQGPNAVGTGSPRLLVGGP